MDVTKEIPQIEEIMENINVILNQTDNLGDCPEKNIVKMKLKEALMWLDVSKKRLDNFSFKNI